VGHEHDEVAVLRRRRIAMVAVHGDVAEPRAVEEHQQFVLEVEVDPQRVLLFADELTVLPHSRAHLVHDDLLQRIEIDDARVECVLGAVGTAAPLRGFEGLPRPRDHFAFGLDPVTPRISAGVRILVVDDEHAAGLELLLEPPQRQSILLASASEPESPADENGLVATRRIELVHRLDEERRSEPLALGLLPAERDHVRRHVAAVDVEPGSEVRDEQPSGAAGDVERRLTALDVLLEVRDLGTVLVELGPPLRDEPVVPGLRDLIHGPHVVVPRAAMRSASRQSEASASTCGRSLRGGGHCRDGAVSTEGCRPLKPRSGLPVGAPFAQERPAAFADGMVEQPQCHPSPAHVGSQTGVKGVTYLERSSPAPLTRPGERETLALARGECLQ
jgi:hypothetical protein